MKYIYLLLIVAACGYYEGPRGRPGRSCTVTKDDSITTVTCPDGTQQTVVDGEKGLQGLPGPAGPNGNPGPSGHDGVSGRDGMAGKDGLSGPQGAPGVDGAQGVQGPTGPTGASGATGPSGTDGQPGTQIIPIVPCPGNTSGYPEALLCIDGSLYAVYDGSPTEVHYAKIPPGTYHVTDGRDCTFRVVQNCEIE